MKMHSFGYSLLAGLMLATMGSQAQGAPAPFDVKSSPSEQLRFDAQSPQIIGSATADSLTFSWQLSDGNSPVSTKLVRFSRSGNSYTKAWEKQLPLPRLVGMTTDGSNFYVVSAVNEEKGSDTSANVFRSNVLIMTKLDSKGNQLWQKDLNSAAYLGNNVASAIYSPMTAGTGAVSYGAGKVVVALASNTQPDPNISGRHQRAQYFVVGADGNGYGAAGETSWRHSFDQRLLFDGQDFVFTDLGDAGWYMPAAGITVRKIRPNANGAEFIGDQDNKQGTYIYARQGETDAGQNYSFTSLGELELGAQGYLALFASETGNPTVMRNGASQPIAEPRNVGFVHVTRNFETVREGKWGEGQTQGNTVIQGEPVSITITRSVVDSSGPSNRFLRPDKTTKSFTQSGIVWLTSLAAGKSAERPKLVKVASDRYVALWEEWNYSGRQATHDVTKAMVINEQGQSISGPTTISARLNPSGTDRPFVLDGKAAWMVGDAATGKFTLFSIGTNLALTGSTIDPSGNTQPQPVIFKGQMVAGDSLKAGDKLQSNNGLYTLNYQTDGNLALYTSSGKFLWNSGTSGQPGSANMQTDGNFAIYGPNNTFKWNTGTTTPGSKLVLRDDGNLVIVTPAGAQIWASNTAQAQTRDRLKAGESLKPGEKLQSSNGLYTLNYQTDGNLVLYTASMQPLWSTGTHGLSPGRVDMQTDGNFAMYGSDGRFQWNTGTVSPGSWITLQTDGNLVVYAPSGTALWTSNTAQ